MPHEDELLALIRELVQGIRTDITELQLKLGKPEKSNEWKLIFVLILALLLMAGVKVPELISLIK